MKMRTLIAGIAALAVSAVSLAALPASAAETSIAYNGPSAGSLATDNDGVSLRRNILNVWTDPKTSDISDASAVVDYITVEFTVSGIGTDSVKTHEDGSTEPLYAWLAGSIGTNPQVWTMADAGDNKVAINGDGTYTVTMPLAEGSESISCLILQTNINFYAYGESIDASGLSLNVNSIKTDDGVEATTAETTAETTAATTATTAAGGTTASTAAGTTTTAAKGGTTTAAAAGGTTTAAATTSNTATGDASGVGLALAAVVVAGGVALVTKKSK